MGEIPIKCRDCGDTIDCWELSDKNGCEVDGLCDRCQSNYSKISPDANLSGSEALYGFCGWLTSRRKPTVMGSAFDCSDIPKLIEEFCKVNKLPEPRGKWSENLTHPSDEQL